MIRFHEGNIVDFKISSDAEPVVDPGFLAGGLTDPVEMWRGHRTVEMYFCQTKELAPLGGAIGSINVNIDKVCDLTKMTTNTLSLI